MRRTVPTRGRGCASQESRDIYPGVTLVCVNLSSPELSTCSGDRSQQLGCIEEVGLIRRNFSTEEFELGGGLDTFSEHNELRRVTEPEHRPNNGRAGRVRVDRQCGNLTRVKASGRYWFSRPFPQSAQVDTDQVDTEENRSLHRTAVVLLGLCISLVCWPANAKVEHVEILHRETFARGTEFGSAGAYEKVHGRAWFALDPNAVANAPIADIKLAPRDHRGLVRFSSEFQMLRPTISSRGNGTLLYEVNNRGNIAILSQINEAPPNNSPATTVDVGNGFLFRQGFTLLWSAWAADVVPGDDRMVLSPPIATKDGEAITGKVAYELIVDEPADQAQFAGLLGTVYPFASAGAPDAALTERAQPGGERRVIPRARWSFGQAEGGDTPTLIALEGGFTPGRIYELTYTARDPTILALGMAGIRDLLSHLQATPLAGAPAPQRTLIFGISQSARLIQTMLLRGLHVDEAGRPVFDGAFLHVAGAGKGGFDYRFAMPTRHFSVIEDHIYPTDFFPFATVTARDPVTGSEASVLDRARKVDAVPKLFYVNGSSEYWNRAASLLTTDPGGIHDLPPAPEARIYAITGAQHYVGVPRQRGIFSNCGNPLNHYRVLRALLVALDRWVRNGTEPPASRYPQIADGTLISVEAYKRAFPSLPHFRLPQTNLEPPRLDFGRRFDTERIADQIPPDVGPPFVTLVPSPDADGLDRGGIALPEMLEPLGTRTGFNTRTESAGFPSATSRWDGSFVPFPRTEAERRATGDPRRSLEGRYANRADYVEKILGAADGVVRSGYLLAGDVGALKHEAAKLYDQVIAHDPADKSCAFLFDE